MFAFGLSLPLPRPARQSPLLSPQPKTIPGHGQGAVLRLQYPSLLSQWVHHIRQANYLSKAILELYGLCEIYFKNSCYKPVIIFIV